MGTTSEKLTYLNTTKTLIKDNLNLGGANISNEPFRVYSSKLIDIYKDFLANGTDVVWNNWLPKVNGTGETITLNNTIEAKMDFVYKGNTSQFSTTGKNLLNDYDLINRYNIASISDNILTTNEINSDYSVFQPRTKTQKIDLVENTKYYVSFDCRLKSGTYSTKLGTSIINGIDATSYSTGNTAISNPNMSSLYQRYSFECISNITTNSVLGIQIQVRTGLSNAVFEIKNIMISTSSDTTYEPYTNGASPNPDYPQDIQVVSGDNTIKVEGKNLFDKDSVVSGFVNADGTIGGDTNAYRTSNFIPIQPNTAYYKTRTDSPRTKYYDSNKQPLNTTTYQDISIGGNEGTFTTPNNACYLRFSYPVASVDANNIMVHKGTTSTSYEPYQSQSYPINIGNIELCKIGTYQDKIYKDNGKWYLNKQIGKVVLDGSEANWDSGLAYGKTVFYYNIADILVSTSSDNEPLLFCNNFKGYKISAFQSYNDYFLGRRTNQIQLLFRNKDIDTLSNFKTWLSTHNTTVYYVLATPTTTEITDTTLISQLEAIKKSYNTQTNISQVNNDLPFELDVVALGELS